MSIIFFLLIFGVIVIAHEFGHYLLARVNGIHVVEFSVGMGPKLFHFTRKGTVYSLRLLPIGGACMFEGQDGVIEQSKKDDEVKTEEDKGSFQKAKVGARIATVIAGPLFNFLLAFVFSLIIVGNAGSDNTKLEEIIPDYPAETAGLQVGDEIISLNGERVYLYREISLFSLMNTKGKDITVVYERDGERYKTKISPQYDPEAERYLIGFKGGTTFEVGSPLDVIKNSYFELRYWIKYTFKSLFMLISGQASVKDLSGPVGVAQVVNEVYEQSAKISVKAIIINMLNFAVLLSANLGVINLLPLPALDGGRLVFLIIELIRRKPIPPEKEGMVHFIGMLLLILLMVFVFYNDIMRLFQ